MPNYNLNTKNKPTWCPGCGNFAIWTALKEAINELNLLNHQVVIVYGIGCSGNMCNTINTYGLHALHGRALPNATGIKLANNNLKVIVVAGDGDIFGEGMGHFIHAIRSDADITCLAHDNKVYGLTAGQASPTLPQGQISRSTPQGVAEPAVNPMLLSLAAGCGFVARGYSGEINLLKELIKEAIQHPGFSFVDILQICFTYNKVNTAQFYNKRIYNLQTANHLVNDFDSAFIKDHEWGDKIPLGLFYKKEIKEKNNLQKINSIKKRDLNLLLKKYKV